MGSFNVNPTTILSKIHVRTPTQAESLSSRYSFLNLNNAEPNLGKPPGIFGGTYYSTLTSDEYLGIRYALLSNNHSGSAWRVWAYDNPRIAAYSKEGSLGIGDNAYPLNIKSFVYSNYAFDNQNNRYNSQSFSNKTFNVFALSGIYLFDSTTIGDPASAIAFIVTDTGNVGIGVEDPAERLTVNGNISSNGSLFVRDLSANNLTVSGNISASGNLTINGNTTLGDSNLDTLTLNGTSVSIPNNLNFDVNTLFIDAANNRVGIGTDTPDQALHVLKASAGTVTADTNSIAVFEGGSNAHISILTPDAQTGGVVFGSPTDNLGSYLSWNHDNNALKLATAKTNGFIQLLTNNEAEAVRITSSGNVGIGTTVPGEKLTVNGSISSNGSTTVLGGNSNQWNSGYTTLNSISSIIPDPATTISAQIGVGTTALNSIDFLNTSSAQLLYTVPAGKVFLASDFSIIIDTVAGGNVSDVSLPAFRLYRSDTLTNAANQVTNQLSLTTPGTLITTNRYYRIGGSVTASNGKALVSGNDASPQNRIWFRVDSAGTNTYTGLSGRVLVTGNLI